MTGGRRPLPVRRYLQRPLWWCAVGVAACTVGIGLDVRRAADEDERVARAIHVEGTVDRSYGGGTDVAVSYRNPRTEQVVDAEAHVWDGDLLPEPGARVRLDVEPDDPGDVHLAGDRFPPTAFVLAWLPFLAIPLLWAALRRWSVARTERLVKAPGSTFAMVGAVRPPRLVGRRCELLLYALDAGPGTPPICVVPLLTTAGSPIAGPAFPVEVKGSPRPFGHVVARTAHGLLWPAARGLGLSGAARPGTFVDTSALRAPMAPTPSARVPRWQWAKVARLWFAGLALATALAVVAILVTLDHRGEATRIDEDGTPVIAEVESIGTGEPERLAIAYTEPGTEERVRDEAEVDDGDDYVAGRRYPARVDPETGRVRMEAEEYAAVPALVPGLAPLILCLLGVARSRVWWRRTLTAAATGPWSDAEVSVVGDWGDGQVVALHPAGTNHVTGTVRLATAPVGDRRRVLVAGSPQPGEPVALVTDDEVLPVRGPAGCDRRLGGHRPGTSPVP